MNENKIISLCNVVKEFHVGAGTVMALRGVSLDIEKGDFVLVMGASGSGKTTLMQVIGGLLSPCSGAVSVAGELLSDMNDDTLSAFRNHSLGFVFQFFQLLPFLTAVENVALPLVFSGVSRAERNKRALSVLSDMGLSHRAHHRTNEMSGGEMQRVAIARAMINEPSVLLADEPTGNLDRATGERILELIRSINRDRHVTVVMVSHDHSITSYAHRLITIDNGEIQ